MDMMLGVDITKEYHTRVVMLSYRSSSFHISVIIGYELCLADEMSSRNISDDCVILCRGCIAIIAGKGFILMWKI